MIMALSIAEGLEEEKCQEDRSEMMLRRKLELMRWVRMESK